MLGWGVGGVVWGYVGVICVIEVGDYVVCWLGCVIVGFNLLVWYIMLECYFFDLYV
jgi:hypothetical protein